MDRDLYHTVASEVVDQVKNEESDLGSRKKALLFVIQCIKESIVELDEDGDGDEEAGLDFEEAFE